MPGWLSGRLDSRRRVPRRGTLQPGPRGHLSCTTEQEMEKGRDPAAERREGWYKACGSETAEQDQFKTGTVTLKRLARATDQRPASPEERPLRKASRALLEYPPQPWAKWVHQAHSLFTFHLPHP